MCIHKAFFFFFLGKDGKDNQGRWNMKIKEFSPQLCQRVSCHRSVVARIDSSKYLYCAPKPLIYFSHWNVAENVICIFFLKQLKASQPITPTIAHITFSRTHTRIHLFSVKLLELTVPPFRGNSQVLGPDLIKACISANPL